MRVLNEPSLIEPFLNYRFSVVDGQPGHVNIVHQREVNIAGATHARLGVELRNVVNADLDQIATTKSERGIAALH